MRIRIASDLLVAPTWAAGWLLAAAGAVVGQSGDDASPSVESDPLALRGYAVTGGAAPGYVDDRVCRSCHRAIYESYQELGMARAFSRPRRGRFVEDFENNHFYHDVSRRHYEMIRRGDDLFMKRYQLDAQGEPINVIEQKVDWMVGSGNRSRLYLFQTPDGELFQLPVAWYSQTQSWGMAPGFDRPGNLGLTRLVRRECLFCHNAYPDVPAGSDAADTPHRFPAELPEGLGCQRCHGPGAEHSRIGMTPDFEFKDLFAAILNPADLPARLRNDICNECHMQSSVALPLQRRFGRGTYSFRPGEPLSEYLVQMDVEEKGKERGDRFEINHHAYRLEQSRCFQQSGGALSCLTCHDPHGKAPAAERAAYVRSVCRGCHEVLAGHPPAGEPGSGRPAAEEEPEAPGQVGDCLACHMPRRRPQDVIRVVMTDHRIGLYSDLSALQAPLTESDPVILHVELRDPERVPAEFPADLYRAVSLAKTLGGDRAPAVEALVRLGAQARLPEEALFVLGKSQLELGSARSAERSLQGLLERSPAYPMATELLGHARFRLDGPTPEALEQFRQAIALGQDRPEARFNFALALAKAGRLEEASVHLHRALEMRPNMPLVRYYLGEIELALGRPGVAASHLRRALELMPTQERGYLALSRALLRLGEVEEALRYLRHGAGNAAHPEEIREELARIERQL